MCIPLSRPTIYEQAYGNKTAPRDHQRDTKLWTANIVVLSFQSTVDLIIQGSANLSSEEEADAQGDVIQATNANGLVVLLFPQNWKCGQYEIHEAVKICHVDRQGLDYGLRAQKFERAYQAPLHSVGERSLRMLELCVEGFVTSLFSKLINFRGKQFRWIGFSEEEKSTQLYDGVGD